MTEKITPKIRQVAEHLQRASRQNGGVTPVTQLVPDLTVEEAYRVQLLNVKKALQAGKKVVGKKIGLTSAAMQESLGVDEPDYGHLLNDMLVPQEDPVIYMDQVLQPRVEGELAFILKEDLTGPAITVEEVLAATDKIVAAIEIVDSRVKDWKINLGDTIADNASSAFYTLGTQTFSPEDMDRIGVQMKLFKNKELINEGDGSAVLGDSAYCVAWLANQLAEYGISLKAGEVILAGALSAAIAAEAGDEFVCEFTEGLGDVTIRFEDRKSER